MSFPSFSDILLRIENETYLQLRWYEDITMNLFFTVHQNQLFPPLASLQSLCARKTPIASTESILFEVSPRELIIKASDLEISAQWSLAIETECNEFYSFLVSGKRIHDLIKELDGVITFQFDGQSLQITTQESGVSLQLPVKEISDFPSFPEKIENLMQLETTDILEYLSKVAFLIPSNNTNPALNGMLLECDEKGMSMVATDGHCLARITTNKYPFSQKSSWLIPKRAVMELKKILDVPAIGQSAKTLFLGTCAGSLVFSGQGFNFFTRLINDPFPQYASILKNDGFFTAVVSKENFLKSMKRAGCLLAGGFVATDFIFNKDEQKVQIKLENKEIGTLKEELVLQKFDGETLSTRFYTPYLLNGLQAINEKNLLCKIKGDKKPLIFETKDETSDFVYLVMPVSTQSQV